MITVYLDWNIISQLKNNYHPVLADLISQTNRFLIPYSTSHIGDILASYKEEKEQLKLIDEDLDLLTDITRNYSLSNNGKAITLTISDPKELFKDRVEQRDILNNFSQEKVAELLKNTEGLESLDISFIELLKNLPLDKNLLDSFSKPENSEKMNALFPGLKDNLTMEGFFKSFGEMNNRINETDDYKILREITQSGLGINRDKIFATNDPYTLINQAYEANKLNSSMLVLDDKHAPVWFNKITNEYLMLDLHGYQEDHVRTSKGRKETFRNTTEDTFHAAFASTCNFYITNDERSYRKTKMVYEKLNLETIVFKPNDFKVYYDKYLSIRNLLQDIQLPLDYLDIDPSSVDQTENGIIRNYYMPYYIFDYFNKMHVLVSNTGEIITLLLGHIPPTNKNMTYFIEIENLSSKIYELMGMDLNNSGLISREELEQDDIKDRSWDFDSISFRFIRVNGHYQFYYDFNTSIYHKKT